MSSVNVNSFLQPVPRKWSPAYGLQDPHIPSLASTSSILHLLKRPHLSMWWIKQHMREGFFLKAGNRREDSYDHKMIATQCNKRTRYTYDFFRAQKMFKSKTENCTLYPGFCSEYSYTASYNDDERWWYWFTPGIRMQLEWPSHKDSLTFNDLCLIWKRLRPEAVLNTVVGSLTSLSGF